MATNEYPQGYSVTLETVEDNGITRYCYDTETHQRVELEPGEQVWQVQRDGQPITTCRTEREATAYVESVTSETSWSDLAAELKAAATPTTMEATHDHGYVTAGEMHALMAQYPDREFELRVDSDQDGEEADTYAADLPVFWAWNEEQVPTDDSQRPLRLQSYQR